MIFRIFKDDLRSAGKYFFTILIIIAICIIPSLYAWINIYANADPYVNTGELPVAVASADKGTTLENGRYLNSASEVLDSLKSNKKIKWMILDDPEAAIEGAKAGKYYAAIVFEDGFTYDMYHFDETLLEDDYTVTYYSNTKKNVVAAKITDAASEALLEEINTKYLETVFDRIFKGAGKLGKKLDKDKTVDRTLDRLAKLRDNLRAYDRAIDSFTADNGRLKSIISDTENSLQSRKSRDKSALGDADEMLKEARKSIDAISERLDHQAATLKKAVDDLEKDIKDIRSTHDQKKLDRLLKKAEKAAEKVLSALEKIRALIPDDPDLSGVRILADTLDLMIIRTEAILDALQKGPADIKKAETSLSQLKSLLDKDLTPDIDLMVSGLDSSLDIVEPLLSSAGGLLENIDPVLNAAGDTITSIDATLAPLQKVLRASAARVDEIISKVRGTDKDQRAAVLLKLMGGDPDKYSRFFTSLVDIRLKEVYPAKPYGNAMSPFYSILAIWVGGVVLVSVLKTRADRKKFPGATETQCFFGRFLLFFLLGQIQAAVIIAGDILLLGVTPVHPGLMFVTAGIASFVFMMLIYSLTLGFGDVGKGIVVVIMVLQISGSGGSYPIEILPDIYDKIYTFFPFPYAINAMREALYGTYGNDIVIYLAQLMIFAVIGMIIGLFVRRPFIGVNRFVTERLEDTEVL